MFATIIRLKQRNYVTISFLVVRVRWDESFLSTVLGSWIINIGVLTESDIVHRRSAVI